MSIRITDNHAPRLARMAPARVIPAMAEEAEAGALAIVDEAVASILDGAITGSGHVASLPGEPPNADTHDLDRSGHVAELVETGDTIKTGAVFSSEHAAHLELGTSKMAERPFLAPAARRLKDAILRSMAQRLRDVRS